MSASASESSSPPEGGNKLWEGRASGRLEDITLELGESISLDIELYREDLYGSAHHARMLRKIGVLTDKECEDILQGLRRVKREIEAGEMPLRRELEDIHTHVENRLIELVGEAGKKLHTGRSRNDQVALDTHLFILRSARAVQEEILALCEAFLARARENMDCIVPGYTHLQAAQPVRLAHHLLAHFWFFRRDFDRFAWARTNADRLPLGSGAMAGVNYPSDREFLRENMDFAEIYPNSMEAVASRDHIMNFLYSCAVFGAHASRLSEEIVIWHSVEFSFITLPDSLTTGSSIMPQKKNPDLAEIIRGKTGRLVGNMNNLFIAVKGLPLTYNRDLQEDRAPLLDSARECPRIARGLTAMVREMKFHPENMKRSLDRGYTQATDLADALVSEKGLSFREAHHVVGRLVARCVAAGCFLSDVPREVRAEVDEKLADDDFYFAASDLAKSADKKISQGGTARFRIEEQLTLAQGALEDMSRDLGDPVSYDF